MPAPNAPLSPKMVRLLIAAVVADGADVPGHHSPTWWGLVARKLAHTHMVSDTDRKGRPGKRLTWRLTPHGTEVATAFALAVATLADDTPAATPGTVTDDVAELVAGVDVATLAALPECRVGPDVLARRLRQGWTAERAMATPVAGAFAVADIGRTYRDRAGRVRPSPSSQSGRAPGH